MTSVLPPIRPWDSPELTAVRRLPMHAVPHPDRVDLDGEWEFQLLPHPLAERGDEWRPIAVPGLWTMQESGDLPHYTNVVMPFDASLPHPPEANPTGVYRRTFTAGEWGDRRVVLHVGAAESVLLVRMNGEDVGISKDSHLAAEFDVTAFVREGVNEVELTVVKWSDASYIEDQDHWWHGGISRSVYLYTTGRTYLADVHAVADYDPNAAVGSLRIEAVVESVDTLGEGWSVRARVAGVAAPEAETVPAPGEPAGMPPIIRGTYPAEPPAPLIPDGLLGLLSLSAAGADLPPEQADIARHMHAMAFRPAPGVVRFEAAGLAVRPWSAEDPQLYRLEVELVAPSGEVVETAAIRVGFRRVEILGRDFLVNGGRVWIQGVNRHDFNPRTGRVVTEEQMRAELAQLKRFNVNAVRTSHYPNDPRFLDLCDEFGLYVVDEANIEAHAHATTLCDDPRYLSAFVDRISRMVRRDKNHPSVVMWSLGNESGYGRNHDAAVGWVRAYDPARPLHYEGAINKNWHTGHRATDVVCPMYPTFEALRAYAAHPDADRPVILCEYAYSQGNSTGGLGEYWDLFEATPGLQGGFIWELYDHALDPDSDGRYRYGGDFGDEPNNGFVCVNGIVFPDGTPKPALHEARHIFAPIRILSTAEDARNGRVLLRNRQTFRDLSGLRIGLRIEHAHGSDEFTTVAAPAIPAGGEGVLALPEEITTQLARPDAVALTLVVRLAEAMAWAGADTELARLQVPLRSAPKLPNTRTTSATATLDLDDAGLLRHPALGAAPVLSFWRAPTDNDASGQLDNRFVRAGLFRVTRTLVDAKAADGNATIVSRYTAAFGAQIEHRQRVTAVATDVFRFDEHVVVPEDIADLPRLGVAFATAPGFEQVSWLGLGPHETYPDRKRSGLLARWSAGVDELCVPYLVPQENGGRADVHEFTVSAPDGRTLTVTADRPVQMNISHHTPDDLETARHWWELTPRAETFVHFDIATRGLGTAALGPDTLPQYRVGPGEYQWSWQLEIVN